MSLRTKLVTLETQTSNPDYISYAKSIKELKAQLLKDGTDVDKLKITNEAIDKLKATRRLLEPSKTNLTLQTWELQTPKEIRSFAVADVVTSYKAAFGNLKNNTISHFKMNFKKKTNPNQCLGIPKTGIKNDNGCIQMTPSFFKCKTDSLFNMGKRNKKKHKNLIIKHDCRITKKKGIYYLFVPVSIETKKYNETQNTTSEYCGIDPGIRTFMTTFSNKECVEYTHKQTMINSKNLKIKISSTQRQKNKHEIRKDNLIDELHWKTIHDVLNRNDIIFYGDIKSHNIVKRNKVNHTLNRNTNELKFYQFKQRLLFKASELEKCVFLVNEAYTTKICSSCGHINDPKMSKTFICQECGLKCGRDVNAPKNILMKGLLRICKVL